jgi:hypothetical protein
MANAATWRERIGGWRASGLSAAKFAESQGLTAHQVWNWAAKFRREDEAKAVAAAAVAVPAVPRAEDVRAKADSIALAKVVRVPRQEPAAKPVTTLLSVELFGIRIAVPTGFDRPTFAMVLDEIEARRARLGER